LLTIRKYADMTPPKKDKVWLTRSVQDATANQIELASPAPRSLSGGMRRTVAVEWTPDNFLSRKRLRQGPPVKAPLIREALWDFFVDLRRSVASVASPKFLLMKAREIAEVVLKAQRETGHYVPMPVINRGWLHRWKRDKGVVYRRPNARYKCSKATMSARLRAMWVNNFKIRRLGEHFAGHDLADSIFGIDEKPVHFNESGSKNCRTLEIVGAPVVRLKQNHAATRERVSVMTCVTSCMAAAVQQKRLPVAIASSSVVP
jgi:hypothetical protein